MSDSDSLDRFVIWSPLSKTPQATPLREQVDQLFLDYRTQLCRYLHLLVNNPAVAEEIVQDAFLRLYVHLRDGGKTTSARNWVFRVPRNLAIDNHRRPTTEPTAADWEGGASATSDPEQTLLKREADRQIGEVIQKLPLRQRECLLLRVEGFRYREIAEMLSLSESAVSEHLRRGLLRITREIHGEWENGRENSRS